ncbi:UDP-3-O-acyl-N-acetylglucosamine deacetylase [Desulfovibrio litoralis]|uniref:UDP-3-O-acyl-N-acetylglucosamine deacetylase n=1 Tax=Desulfovibrio litoralis DSM 11393 TaxID=1121455 RepID=A0A1M7TDE8_9BACT|nr:UDP-3-O-acyl-N-acetylglucosamine deacetylase [Desulfovibrio litoralis]SHN68804.1 UDP-3-O-[3-hydroxymyristoyl] N-acetylglucosamine deacetylase [Desulfovibrio litoralis DSM 11393]
MYQTTIKQQVSCNGIGLHSGKTINMTFCPAIENSGIVFEVKQNEIPQRLSLKPNAVIATELATTLGQVDTFGIPQNSVSVSTIEHVLAAVRALNIDNILIKVDGFEVPVLDGSAAPYLILFQEAGITQQNAIRRVLRIKKELSLQENGKSIIARPHKGFFVDYTIDFPHPLIKTQRLKIEITPESFKKIAFARTFGFFEQVEAMRKRGLALGGSLENAIVLNQNSVLNPEGLRSPDEFVRHKVLDFVGDMAMLGTPLEGSFTVHCSGHALNNSFLRMLVEHEDEYLLNPNAPKTTHIPKNSLNSATFRPSFSL